MSRHFREQKDEEQRASWLELFFDLVYVFAVTQLSHAILADHSPRGLLRAAFLLLVVWWGGSTRPGWRTGSTRTASRCGWC